MLKVIKFMEKMWLMVSIVTFIIAIVRSFQTSVFDSLYFYGFSAIAIFLFMMRRIQRKKYEKKEDRS